MIQVILEFLSRESRRKYSGGMSFHSCLLPYPVLRETVVIQKMKEFYMVIGGSGFLGRHIVQQLVDRGDNVCIFDIVQRYFDVPFYPGDITNIDDVTNALQKV